MRKHAAIPLLVIALVSLSAFYPISSSKKKTDWDELKSFKIYNLNSSFYNSELESLDYTALDTVPFIETNINKTKEILGKANRQRKQLTLWKGYHFAVAEFNNGDHIKIKISTYGGFFMELERGTVYEFKDAVNRKMWNAFLGNAYHELYSH